MQDEIQERIDRALRVLAEDKAEEALDLLACTPANPVCHYEYVRGLCLVALERLPAAKQALKSELVNFPGNKEVEALLRAVEEELSKNTTIMADVRSVLWVRTDSVTGAVLSSGMLPLLQRRFPDAKIFVACTQQIASLYENLPFVSSVFAFDPVRLNDDERYRNACLTGLRAITADLVLNSHSVRDALCDFIALNVGARQRVGFKTKATTCEVDRDTQDEHYTLLVDAGDENIHEFEKFRSFLAALQISTDQIGPLLWTSREDFIFADAVCQVHALQKDRTIALMAGESSSPTFYPELAYAIAGICQERQLSVVALGVEEEREHSQAMLDQLGVNTLNLCGRTTLRQAAAMLKRCRIAVGTEGGLSHIAATVGTPHVVIVGGGNFGRYHPYSPLGSIGCLPLGCYRCDWRCNYEIKHCVRGIHPAIAAKAVSETLDSVSAAPRVFCVGPRLYDRLIAGPSYQSLIKHENWQIFRVE